MVIFGGCAQPIVVAVRERLLESARSQIPDFADEKAVQLVHFAHVGKVQTSKGPLYVIFRREVLAGMPSPRGLRSIDFFDENYRHAGSITCQAETEPLWCAESKVFLFGNNLIPALGPEEGNVIDLHDGVAKASLRIENRYGSSGGIEE